MDIQLQAQLIKNLYVESSKAFKKINQMKEQAGGANVYTGGSVLDTQLREISKQLLKTVDMVETKIKNQYETENKKLESKNTKLEKENKSLKLKNTISDKEREQLVSFIMLLKSFTNKKKSVDKFKDELNLMNVETELRVEKETLTANEKDAVAESQLKLQKQKVNKAYVKNIDLLEDIVRKLNTQAKKESTKVAKLSSDRAPSTEIENARKVLIAAENEAKKAKTKLDTLKKEAKKQLKN